MTICQKVIIESQLQFTYNVWFELLWNIRYNICCWLGESHSSSLPRYGPHYQNEGSTYHETWFKGLKDIPTLYFSTPSFNPGPFNPRLFKYELFNPRFFNHEFLNHAWGWKVHGQKVLNVPKLRSSVGLTVLIYMLWFWTYTIKMQGPLKI